MLSNFSKVAFLLLLFVVATPVAVEAWFLPLNVHTSRSNLAVNRRCRVDTILARKREITATSIDASVNIVTSPSSSADNINDDKDEESVVKKAAIVSHI